MSDHLRVPDGAASMVDGPTGPLVGLRILDVTHAAAGPFATQMLADLGADVIKVERPGGEFVRFVDPFHPDDHHRELSARFASRHRNKRSITLDLGDRDDRETFLQLVETADGLVENMRAGVLDKLGVGWGVCHVRNPRLVYAAIRGFGDPRTGESPYVDWPAYDVIAQAMGGFVAMTGPDPQTPLRGGTIVGDFVPGLQLALGLVSGLLHAQRTGEGQFLDVAMVDGVMSICEPAQTTWVYKGYDYEPAGNDVDDVVPFTIYPTADGQCALAAPMEKQWRILCEVIGRPELIDDPRTRSLGARVKHRELVDDVLEQWCRAHTTAEIVEQLGGEIPVGPVYRPSDWIHDPHVAAREMLVAVDHPHHPPVAQLACPIRFTATPAGVYRRPPLVNEHGEELREELLNRRGAAGRS